MKDELRAEYDLENMVVRKVGPGRKYFAGKPVIYLEPDVAAEYPTAAAVNIALRDLIAAKKGKSN